MSVSQHDWSLHRKGQIDQERHKEKIREAIKKNLSAIVSEEGIILSDGKKMVRVPIRSLDEYRFRNHPGRQQHLGDVTNMSQVCDVTARKRRPVRVRKADANNTAGHHVEMADGSYKDVSEIATGDQVACIDFETLEKTTSHVVETFSKTAPETLAIEAEDATLRATPQHVYFVYDEPNNLVIEK